MLKFVKINVYFPMEMSENVIIISTDDILKYFSSYFFLYQWVPNYLLY